MHVIIRRKMYVVPALRCHTPALQCYTPAFEHTRQRLSDWEEFHCQDEDLMSQAFHLHLHDVVKKRKLWAQFVQRKLALAAARQPRQVQFIEPYPTMGSCPLCGTQANSLQEILNHNCITVCDQTGLMTVCDQTKQVLYKTRQFVTRQVLSSSDIDDSSVPIWIPQPRSYMLPSLRRFLFGEGGDDLSDDSSDASGDDSMQKRHAEVRHAEFHAEEARRRGKCVNCKRHAEGWLSCTNEIMCLRCIESKTQCTCSKGSSCTLSFILFDDESDEGPSCAIGSLAVGDDVAMRCSRRDVAMFKMFQEETKKLQEQAEKKEMARLEKEEMARLEKVVNKQEQAVKKLKQRKLQEQAEQTEMARLEKVAESLRRLPRSLLRRPPGLTHPSRLAVDPNIKSIFLEWLTL